MDGKAGQSLNNYDQTLAVTCILGVSLIIVHLESSEPGQVQIHCRRPNSHLIMLTSDVKAPLSSQDGLLETS